MGATRCVALTALLVLMQPSTPDAAAAAAATTAAAAAGSVPQGAPQNSDAEYVQNMVTSALGAAMKVIGDGTHQRFRKLEGDFAEVSTAIQNITGAVQHVLHQCRPLWLPISSMDSLVIVAPLHVALDIIQGYGDKTGWYDSSGLWRPYVQEPDQHKFRTTLRAAADPFIPATHHGEQGLPASKPNTTSSRREVDELQEKHQNDANAVSHMLNGGDESSSGRQSREPDSPMYNPGYDPEN